MTSLHIFSKSKVVWDNGLNFSRVITNGIGKHISLRGYAKRDDDCRRACVDIPPDVDPVCPQPCERQKKTKKGILHKIKLKIIEGGTNFGSK